MTNRVVITIKLPDGVVPDVQYQQTPDGTTVHVADAYQPPPEFPPFPSQASSVPQCKVHTSAMKPGRSGGWYCPRKVGDGWCTERVNA